MIVFLSFGKEKGGGRGFEMPTEYLLRRFHKINVLLTPVSYISERLISRDRSIKDFSQHNSHEMVTNATLVCEV